MNANYLREREAQSAFLWELFKAYMAKCVVVRDGRKFTFEFDEDIRSDEFDRQILKAAVRLRSRFPSV